MNQQVRITDWLEGSHAMKSETIALRRSIHREPELGLKTPKTLAKVNAALAGLPLQFKSGPSTTGLIAILEGARPGRTVLLRGDMDALPMPEDTTSSFVRRLRRDACVRPRRAHRDARVRREADVRTTRSTRRTRDVHVPARRRRLARRALHDRRRLARQSRRRTRRSRSTSRRTRPRACCRRKPVRCSRPRTSWRSRCAAAAATRRCRIRRSTRSRLRARS